MQTVPLFSALFFTVLALLTVWMFWRATGKKRLFLLVIGVWIGIQALAGLLGFYHDTNVWPPRLFLQVVPALLTVISLFLFQRTRRWMDEAQSESLTLLHIVRVGAEITIFSLFTSKLMPEELTFEGRNFDILAGLTAPLVYYFGYVKRRIGRRVLLLWNAACLVLLLNIVIHAALAVPTPFQQLGFEQPNVGILYFPFNLLPSLVVPLVMLSQLICLRQLWKVSDV
jgi:hypothetical protein